MGYSSTTTCTLEVPTPVLHLKPHGPEAITEVLETKSLTPPTENLQKIALDVKPQVLEITEVPPVTPFETSPQTKPQILEITPPIEQIIPSAKTPEAPLEVKSQMLEIKPPIQDTKTSDIEIKEAPKQDTFTPDIEKGQQEQGAVKRGDTVETCLYPEVQDPVDPARILTQKDLRNQRIVFLGTIVLLNICMTITALFGKKSKIVMLLILFIKSKDFLSAIVSPSGLICRKIYRIFRPLQPVPQLWICSLIPAYSESEEQIVKTIFSLRDNDVEPHKQVMVVVLDGNPRDVRSHMTSITKDFERPYVSLKWKRGVLKIFAGFMENVPVICIEKVKNAGKKDSLVLCHDLFNYPRDNCHEYTQLLRKEIWDEILPAITGGELGTGLKGFDQVFCTDADSTIYKGALAKLANAIARDKNAIAACGLVLVELEPGYEWSFWNLYQQFQYTFGQYVRRRAEGFYGKVTCLPGCITMIAVREEMAGAIRKYAEPITGYLVVSHQVQYLGTDRRLTYSMLSQGTHLRTLFEPDAISETVAPQSIQHYLSQRRRWGSNAYFNNYFYLGGEKMIALTRIAATIEVVRLSMVYYRVLNTALFIKSLVAHASIMKLIPMLIIGQLPSVWFFVSVLIEKELRMRGHKLILGYCINKMISPFMSVIIFTKVATNLGSQVWGMSGVTASSAPAAAAPAEADTSNDLSAAERGEIVHKEGTSLVNPENTETKDENTTGNHGNNRNKDRRSSTDGQAFDIG